MKYQVFISETLAADYVCAKICQLVKHKPNAVLGLATGKTPLLVYQKLIKAYQDKQINFEAVSTFNLDEYFSLAANDHNSYHYYMWQNLFQYINIKQENVHILNGVTKNWEKDCKEFEDQITKVGGIDLQLLGIGTNGHIGFNEPGSDFSSKTRLVTLAASTLENNSKYFSDRNSMPKQALSMGLATVLQTKKIILLAFGTEKAEIILKSLSYSPNEEIPASILQNHADVEFVLDKAAAAKINSELFERPRTAVI